MYLWYFKWEMIKILGLCHCQLGEFWLWQEKISKFRGAQRWHDICRKLEADEIFQFTLGDDHPPQGFPHLPWAFLRESTLEHIYESCRLMACISHDPWEWHIYLHWSHKKSAIHVGKYTSPHGSVMGYMVKLEKNLSRIHPLLSDCMWTWGPNLFLFFALQKGWVQCSKPVDPFPLMARAENSIWQKISSHFVIPSPRPFSHFACSHCMWMLRQPL